MSSKLSKSGYMRYVCSLTQPQPSPDPIPSPSPNPSLSPSPSRQLSLLQCRACLPCPRVLNMACCVVWRPVG